MCKRADGFQRQRSHFVESHYFFNVWTSAFSSFICGNQNSTLLSRGLERAWHGQEGISHTLWAFTNSPWMILPACPLPAPTTTTLVAPEGNSQNLGERGNELMEKELLSSHWVSPPWLILGQTSKSYWWKSYQGWSENLTDRSTFGIKINSNDNLHAFQLFNKFFKKPNLCQQDEIVYFF